MRPLQSPPEIVAHLSTFGSAELRYAYATPGHVAGSIEVLDVARSLVFIYPFNGRAENAPRIQTLEGVWWRHTPDVDGFVGLGNTTETNLAVTVQVVGSRGTALAPLTLDVPAHAMEFLDLDVLTLGLPRLENQNGGIRVQFEGSPGDITVAGGLVNDTVGYSANMLFAARDHHEGQPTTTTFASAGIMVGDPDPTAGFPVGARFEAYAAIRNTTAKPLTVKPVMNYLAGSRPVTRSLPTIRLGAFETRYVTFERHFDALGVRGLSGMINIGLTFHGRAGDLLVATGSTDQSGNYVFEVKPQGVRRTSSKQAHYWKVANGFETMFTLWNPTPHPQQLLVTFFFGEDGGRYELPVTLERNASTTIDVAKLITAQRPDLKGHLIPFGTREGSVAFSSAKGMTEAMTVVIGGGILSVLNATCEPTCIDCCGYSNPHIAPSSATIGVGGTAQLAARATYCSGEVQVISASWMSDNPSVATVGNSTGVVEGTAEGSANITAIFQEIVLFTGQICDVNPECPQGRPQSQAPVTVFCARPTNFRQTAGHVFQEGVLNFEYRWDSTTGQLGDLSHCLVGERVSYSPWPWPSPPFRASLPNPHIINAPASDGVFTDTHTTERPFLTPYSSVSVNGAQVYRHNCRCAIGEPEWTNLFEPFGGLNRAFSPNGDGTWRFTISKSNIQSVISPLP